MKISPRTRHSCLETLVVFLFLTEFSFYRVGSMGGGAEQQFLPQRGLLVVTVCHVPLFPDSSPNKSPFSPCPGITALVSVGLGHAPSAVQSFLT